MPRIVIIADDLTGAADCAASSAAQGYSAVVLLHSTRHDDCEAHWPDADILSIDANSRCLPVEQASELIARLVRQCESRNADCPPFVLYKKIDSTLRGNVASELAALLRARRSMNPANAKLSIVMAPALPGQGRTTVGGRIFVQGAPLEKTEIRQSDSRVVESDIPQLLGEADLSCALIDLNSVRSGFSRLRQAISQSAREADVVLCDAETDSDLSSIAEASLDKPTFTAMVGSAGLACQIPHAAGIEPEPRCREWGFCAGPTLFVVGTPSSVSRQQTRMLEAIPQIASFHAPPSLQFDSQNLHTQIVQSLQSGRDVLLNMSGAEPCSNHDGQSLPVALSDLVAECAQFLGGLVATGGETARAVLDALGIDQLRLLGEVEAGSSFAVSDGWVRPLPIITKAGAFGSPQALVRCREFLQNLKRVPAGLRANDPLLDHKS